MPEHALLPTQRIFNLPHHIGMVWEGLAFDVSYAQQWKSKLAEVMARVIEPAQPSDYESDLEKKIKHSNQSAREDPTGVSSLNLMMVHMWLYTFMIVSVWLRVLSSRMMVGMGMCVKVYLGVCVCVGESV